MPLTLFYTKKILRLSWVSRVNPYAHRWYILTNTVKPALYLPKRIVSCTLFRTCRRCWQQSASFFHPNSALLHPSGCNRRLETDLTGEAGVSQWAVALLYLMCLLALFGGLSFLRHCQADLWDAVGGGEKERVTVREVERQSAQCYVRTLAIHSTQVQCQSKSQVHGELHTFLVKTSDNSIRLVPLKIVSYS